jgi:hypothetical protein
MASAKQISNTTGRILNLQLILKLRQQKSRRGGGSEEEQQGVNQQGRGQRNYKNKEIIQYKHWYYECSDMSGNNAR